MLRLNAERCEVSDVSARRNTSAGPRQEPRVVPEREEIFMGPENFVLKRLRGVLTLASNPHLLRYRFGPPFGLLRK